MDTRERIVESVLKQRAGKKIEKINKHKHKQELELFNCSVPFSRERERERTANVHYFCSFDECVRLQLIHIMFLSIEIGVRQQNDSDAHNNHRQNGQPT